MRFSLSLRRDSLALLISAFLLIGILTTVSIWIAFNWALSDWTTSKAHDAARISNAVARAQDWSAFAALPHGRGSDAFALYQRDLRKFKQLYFPEPGGELYLSVVARGDELTIDPDDPKPFDDMGPASPFTLRAMATRQTVFNDEPYTDATGTYIAAETPIVDHAGNVVGVLGASYDSSTLSDIRSIATRVFWVTILPTSALALLLAILLTRSLTTQREVLKQLDDATVALQAPPVISKQTDRGDLSERLPSDATRTEMEGANLDSPTAMPTVPAGDERVALSKLTPRQREIAIGLGRGLQRKEIANELGVSLNTVKTHLKKIHDETGLDGKRLALLSRASGGTFT